MSHQLPLPWILYGIVIHIILLGSVFVTYFRSPVITGLQPQNDLENYPAKRLVLIVTDGLRADSFFKDDFKYVPNLKKIFMNTGLLGLSHTRVPTESRPGHIAIIAGLYEDPSAVTRGWKENPIDFDSVFNRSQKTYAWGSNDILSIFTKCADEKKIEFSSYKDALDFSGKDATYLLDNWVFENVQTFLRNNVSNLRNDDKTIFFLHLLGLDSAGHIHKPNSKEFNENLLFTDNGIYQIYKLFEEVFNDKRTAYILTSDHGMTDLGSHGAGALYETETPLMIWGSGIRNWYDKFPTDNNKNHVQIENYNIGLIELEQADISPLISSIIGIAPAVNNYGKLPLNVLNASLVYVSKALFNNALQVVEQYKKLHDEFNQGLFSSILNNFNKIDFDYIDNMKKYIFNSNNDKEFLHTKLIQQSSEILNNGLEGIEYFQVYYQNPLKFCIILTILGWILQLVILLRNNQINFNFKKIHKIFYLIFLIKIIFIYLQNVTLSIGIYFLLPLTTWTVSLQNIKFTEIIKLLQKNIRNIILLLITIEILVSTFFFRQIISFLFLLFNIKDIYLVLKNSEKYFKKFIYSYIISTIIICIFPFLPSANGRNDAYLIFLAILIWVTRITDVHIKHNTACKVYLIIFLINIISCNYFYNNKIGIPSINLIISWLLLFIGFIAPILFNTTAKVSIKTKIKLIYFYLTGIYINLSISYESVFIIFLTTYFLSKLQLNNDDYKEKSIIDDYDSNDNVNNNGGDNMIENYLNLTNIKLNNNNNNWSNIILAFYIVLFIILSFFGTGNIASISSFDPNISRYYITTFKPFIIMMLCILKLAIPIILIMAGFSYVFINENNSIKNNYKIFLCILIICNIMNINFFLLIQNHGSWLDIGTSISHFVIMEVTTLIVALIYYIVKFLITFQFKRNYFFLN